MDPDLKWVIGIGVTVITFIIGLIAGSFRNLAGRITNNTAALHKRIDTVKDTYVRRDDLESHLQRIDSNIRDLRQEMREGHQQVIEAVQRSKD